MTNHRNDERTVHCPVEDCDATPLARGINLHVNRSSGNGHGPRGEVPDRITFENMETVGSEQVEMDYPEERDTEDAVRLCPYCSRPCEGTNGVLIHLGQVAGRRNHPENPDEKHSQEDFPRAEVDEQGNITHLVDGVEEGEQRGSENGMIPVERVYSLIAALLADDEARAAQIVRQHLIEVEETGSRTIQKTPYPELYQALLIQNNADDPNEGISATHTDEGIQISCCGKSVLATAGEARDIAAGLEQSISENTEKATELNEFIKFLRYHADILEGESKPFEFYTDFEKWGE
ncbi:hypothetical protein [Halovenus salina]|uniref:C2H2-type domain-containing protein n=1 Tax=Halovenus salina TaxID=1510225 RepID=A0ABD5W4G1_9EURY|nr:hypothetical protein [Halovenus salina]